ncbi:MAG: polysaccharide deacetylase family protein [Lachnospiraceae bacterium]|nr:polysaccharide deacetylase family protein [Lachnospiraceae bacterium]
MKRTVLTAVLSLTTAGALLLGGCTRSQINYQIAEAIGTDGKYENNEPVETPKMAEARKLLEESESEEASLLEILDQAEQQARGYNFEEAISILNTIPISQARDERVSEARSRYEEGDTDLVNWVGGDIPHLCFPTLIYDTMMAFDGDDKASDYNTTMVTCDEFSAILESLYENGYVLIDIHSIAAMVTDERGTSSMEEKTLKLPDGKKPIVLSQDNLNYSTVRNGDGIATRLVLEDGKVKAQYTDSEGHEVAGDYDFIPILDSFIETHPDFSFRGARGIVSVSGSEGVFGYRISSGTDQTASGEGSQEQDASVSGSSSQGDDQTVAQIADALRAEGWSIACAGWSHSYMNDMSMETFASEIDDWLKYVGSLTGEADILFYPYGAEVEYPGDKLNYLLDHGFRYLCGLWGDTDFRELSDGYMRMTRRFVDGYTLINAPVYFTNFFDSAAVVDDDR